MLIIDKKFIFWDVYVYDDQFLIIDKIQQADIISKAGNTSILLIRHFH